MAVSGWIECRECGLSVPEYLIDSHATPGGWRCEPLEDEPVPTGYADWL